MPNVHEAIKIVRKLSISGPPVRYRASSDTYDCRSCGPNEFTIAEAFDWRCHGSTCAWRLAVEFCRTPDQEPQAPQGPGHDDKLEEGDDVST